MNKNQAKIIFLLSAAVFLLALLISSRLFFRLDLTKNKSYTLSEVSRNLYKEISDELKITYFVSKRLVQAHPTPGEIADLLQEYSAHSRGRIRFIQKDPASEELVQEVERLGIIPQQIQLEEKNEITVATVYTGILMEYLDRELVIPVVFSLETLEYDLTTRIRSLVRNVEREIGVIVGDSYKQWNSEYVLLNRELVFSGFNVRQINPTETIPGSLPALLVLGGVENLSEEELINIDSYVIGGGNVLFALDGIFVDTRGSFEARPQMDQGLLALLANYGVVVRQALVLDMTALNISFQTQVRGANVVQTIRYPEWINIPPQGGNPNHPVTTRFGGLDLYWPSPLELSPPENVSADVLILSSNQAWLQTEKFITNPNFIRDFQNEAEKTTGTKILAVSLSGLFPSGFMEEVPLPMRKNPSRIVVIGNTLFAGAMMEINRGQERNLNFLIRAADWLSNEEDIVAIRRREVSAGRLDRITDPGRRNIAISFSRSINTIVVPLIVIIVGVFLVWKRRIKPK